MGAPVRSPQPINAKKCGRIFGFFFWRGGRYSLILPCWRATTRTMRTLFVIFVLALVAIAFEIYSDPGLKSANTSHAAGDLAAVAIAHGVKSK